MTNEPGHPMPSTSGVRDDAVEIVGDVPDWTFDASSVALMMREPDGFAPVGTAPLLGSREVLGRRAI